MDNMSAIVSSGMLRSVSSMHLNGVYIATHCNTNDEEEERGRSNDNEIENYSVAVIYINTVIV